MMNMIGEHLESKGRELEKRSKLGIGGDDKDDDKDDDNSIRIEQGGQMTKIKAASLKRY